MAFSRLHKRPGRGGFTLVELLIVMIILAVLFTLAVLIVPNLDEKRAAARGADLLQQWLMTAKSRALRDKAPRGIHLIPDANGRVREVEYVEQPPDFLPVATGGPTLGFGSPLAVYTPAAALLTQVVILGFNEQGAIQPDDILQNKHGTITNHRVLAVQPNQTDPNYSGYGPSLVLTLYPALPSNPQVPHTEYTIIRRWRPLQGEPTQRLPTRVVVDTAKNLPFAPGATPPTYGYDNPLPSFTDPYTPTGPRQYVIMFTPAGPLVDPRAGRAILWVRHEDNVGDQTLVTVYSLTGGIVAHPVDTVLSPIANPDPLEPGTFRYLDPYSFTRDGVGSGL
jgi:prepilin-type N-terminal cleavage/methylation domain-containing protein